MEKNYKSVFVDQEFNTNKQGAIEILSSNSRIKKSATLLFSMLLIFMMSFVQTSFGQITEGEVNENIPTTTLRSDFCGVLVNPIDNVFPAGIVGATGYKFNIYDAAGTTLLASVENSYSRFRFAQIDFVFGATYQVKVQVKVGEEFGAEGTACAVTINPIPQTTIVAAQCGATVSYTDNIFPIGVTGATGYIFNIYDETGSTLIASVENTFSRFRFIQLPFEFGATYQVKVQVRSGNAIGEEGAGCLITLGDIPTTTLVDSQCNEIVYIVDRVNPKPILGADGYRYNIYNQAGTTLLASVDNPAWFRFTQINYSVNTNYTVKIQVKFGSIYGEEGEGCLVKLRDFPTTTIVADQCGQTLSYMDNVFPIGVDGADGYIFNIYDATGVNLVASIENPESRFRFAQMNFDFGATYQVKVQVKRGTYTTPEGAACVLTLEGIPTTTVRLTQCGTTVEPNDNIFPVGITGATGYIFNIYDATGTTQLASIENTYSRFRFNQFASDRGATYLVKVQVKRGAMIGAEGAGCLITVAAEAIGFRQGMIADKDALEFKAVAYPNPFSDNFKVSLDSESNSSVQVQVYDMLGKLLEDKTVNTSDLQTLEVGNNYAVGIYNVILTQDSNVQTVRVIKR